MSQSHKSLMAKIAQINLGAQRAKRAEEVGTPPTQPGDTSHPSGSKPDNTQDANTGSRAAENVADTKANAGPPSVESAPGPNISAAPTLVNIGTQQSLTGEDKETTKTTQSVEDPAGTEHPANAATEKYSSASYQEIRKYAADLSNHLMAQIAMGAQPAAPQATQPAPQTQTDAYAEGYKTASDLQVKLASTIGPLVQQAQRAADLTVAWLQKEAAEEEAAEQEPTEQAAGAPSGGGNASPSAPAGPAAPAGPPMGDGDSDDAAVQELLAVLSSMGITPEQLLQMLEQGGGAGGGAPPEAAGGGMPPEAAGGMPPDAGGGMPPADPNALPPEMAGKMASQDLRQKIASYTLRHGARLDKFAANPVQRAQIKIAIEELTARSRRSR